MATTFESFLLEIWNKISGNQRYEQSPSFKNYLSQNDERAIHKN